MVKGEEWAMKNSLPEEGLVIVENKEAAEGGARRAGVLMALAGLRGTEGLDQMLGLSSWAM